MAARRWRELGLGPRGKRSGAAERRQLKRLAEVLARLRAAVAAAGGWVSNSDAKR